MSVKQSLSKNNFWGLVEQKGPWKETRTDIERSRTGGIRHPGHGNWKVMVNPYQQDASRPSQPLSITLQRRVNTKPLKFSTGPAHGRGMTAGGLTRTMGMKPTDIESGGHPGIPGPSAGDDEDGGLGGDGLADNDEAFYERLAKAQYRNVTQGVNMPGVGFSGDINLDVNYRKVKKESTRDAMSASSYYDAEDVSPKSASTVYYNAVDPSLLQELHDLRDYSIPKNFNLDTNDLEKLFESEPQSDRESLRESIVNNDIDSVKKAAKKLTDKLEETPFYLTRDYIVHLKLMKLQGVEVPQFGPVSYPSVPSASLPSSGVYMDVDSSHTGLTGDLSYLNMYPSQPSSSEGVAVPTRSGVPNATFKPPGNGKLHIVTDLKTAQDNSIYNQFIPSPTTNTRTGDVPPVSTRTSLYGDVVSPRFPSGSSYMPSTSSGYTSGSGIAPKTPPIVKNRTGRRAAPKRKKKSDDEYVPSPSTAHTSGSGSAPKTPPVKKGWKKKKK